MISYSTVSISLPLLFDVPSLQSTILQRYAPTGTGVSKSAPASTSETSYLIFAMWLDLPFVLDYLRRRVAGFRLRELGCWRLVFSAASISAMVGLMKPCRPDLSLGK